MDVKLLQARVALRLVHADELASEAATALAEGADSPSLRRLAGLSPSESAYSGAELWRQACAELSLGSIDAAAAARIHATSILREVASGARDPLDAAEALSDVSVRVGDASFHDLDPFVYAASEMQSRPNERPLFSRMVTEEARQWLSGARTTGGW